VNAIEWPQPRRVFIGATVLQAHWPVADVIWHAQSILDAVTTACRAMRRTGDSPEDRKDRFQASIRPYRGTLAAIVAAYYFDEAYEVFTRRHDGLGWMLAELGAPDVSFPPAMQFSELRSLFQRDSSFMNPCGMIRDKWACRVDPGLLQSWLAKEPTSEDIEMFRHSGHRIKDVMADVSALAAWANEQGLNFHEFGDQVGRVTLAFTPLIDSMCIGIAKKFDLVEERRIKNGRQITYLLDRKERDRLLADKPFMTVGPSGC
jgi:hypothetical protein